MNFVSRRNFVKTGLIFVPGWLVINTAWGSINKRRWSSATAKIAEDWIGNVAILNAGSAANVSRSTIIVQANAWQKLLWCGIAQKMGMINFVPFDNEECFRVPWYTAATVSNGVWGGIAISSILRSINSTGFWATTASWTWDTRFNPFSFFGNNVTSCGISIYANNAAGGLNTGINNASGNVFHLFANYAAGGSVKNFAGFRGVTGPTGQVNGGNGFFTGSRLSDTYQYFGWMSGDNPFSITDVNTTSQGAPTMNPDLNAACCIPGLNLVGIAFQGVDTTHHCFVAYHYGLTPPEAAQLGHIVHYDVRVPWNGGFVA